MVPPPPPLLLTTKASCIPPPPAPLPFPRYPMPEIHASCDQDDERGAFLDSVNQRGYEASHMEWMGVCLWWPLWPPFGEAGLHVPTLSLTAAKTDVRPLGGQWPGCRPLHGQRRL